MVPMKKTGILAGPSISTGTAHAVKDSSKRPFCPRVRLVGSDDLDGNEIFSLLITYSENVTLF